MTLSIDNNCFPHQDYNDNDNTLAEDALDLSMGDDFPAAIEPGTLVRMKEKKSITIMISAWYIKEFP